MNEPRDLYSDKHLAASSGRLRTRWIILAAVTVPLLALFVWSMIRRIQWVSMASVIAAGVFSVFWIDLFCMPEIHYRKLVITALTGRNHVQAMEFSRMEPDPVMTDGVPCRALIFLGEPDKHGSREQLYYLDQSLPLPELTPGQTYTLKYSGRIIIGIG